MLYDVFVSSHSPPVTQNKIDRSAKPTYGGRALPTGTKVDSEANVDRGTPKMKSEAFVNLSDGAHLWQGSRYQKRRLQTCQVRAPNPRASFASLFSSRQFDLAESDYEVVLQMSIYVQIRLLILYISNDEG